MENGVEREKDNWGQNPGTASQTRRKQEGKT